MNQKNEFMIWAAGAGIAFALLYWWTQPSDAEASPVAASSSPSAAPTVPSATTITNGTYIPNATITGTQAASGITGNTVVDGVELPYGE